MVHNITAPLLLHIKKQRKKENKGETTFTTPPFIRMRVSIDDCLFEFDTTKKAASVVAADVTGIPSAVLVYRDKDCVVMAAMDSAGRSRIAAEREYFTCTVPAVVQRPPLPLSSLQRENSSRSASFPITVDGVPMDSRDLTSSLQYWTPDANAVLTYQEGERRVIAAMRPDGTPVVKEGTAYQRKSVRRLLRQQRRTSVLRAVRRTKKAAKTSFRKLVHRVFMSSQVVGTPCEKMKRISIFWKTLSLPQKQSSSKRLLRQFLAVQ